ncbi:hypothetical protein ACLOJK_018219 [Asimina triloba]
MSPNPGKPETPTPESSFLNNQIPSHPLNPLRICERHRRQCHRPIVVPSFLTSPLSLSLSAAPSSSVRLQGDTIVIVTDRAVQVACRLHRRQRRRRPVIFIVVVVDSSPHRRLCSIVVVIVKRIFHSSLSSLSTRRRLCLTALLYSVFVGPSRQALLCLLSRRQASPVWLHYRRLCSVFLVAGKPPLSGSTIAGSALFL